MVYGKPGTRPQLDALAGRLVAESGISEVQAKELVTLLGTDWSSLMREAKLLLRTNVKGA